MMISHQEFWGFFSNKNRSAIYFLRLCSRVAFSVPTGLGRYLSARGYPRVNCNGPALTRRDVRVSIEYLERDALLSQALGECEAAEPGADDENSGLCALGGHVEYV